MAITIERQREASDAVLQAALAWWETCRPVGWGLRQHLDNPRVNMRNEAEKRLAETVAAAVEIGLI